MVSPYGLAAPEFPVRVVDQGVVGERGHDGVLVEGVDGGDVPRQDGGECRGRRETLLPSGGVARYTTGSGERSLVAVSGHRQR
jgi:hypothetical protein